MGEQLKGNQHKIDVAEPKGKITGADFAKLRTMKKEETEQVKESGEMGAVKDTKGSVLMKHKTSGKEMNVVNSPEVIKQHKDRGYEKVSTMKKEDVEQIDELKKSTLASYVNKASDSAAKSAAGSTGWAHTSLKAKNPRVKAAAEKYSDEDEATRQKRLSGIGKAVGRLAKEEVQQIDELNKDTLKSYVSKATDSARTMPGYGTSVEKSKKTTRHAGISRATEKLAKEEVELQEMSDMIDALILEYESKGGVYKHKGTYGTAKGAEYGETDYDKENEMAKKKDKPARKAYGARQNYVRSTRVNESFTELLSKYQEGGVRALNESLYIVEEADNEQFHAEVEENKKKAEGKVKQPEVAKGAVKAVAITKEEIEQIDERQMTEPEMKEREKIVKGMKKGIAGFKQRYGERAKSVMYATATKQAMKD
jgi:hypothetical protein